MATLRLIADEISGAHSRPFDMQYKERIKSIFRHEAATIVRQAINKDGLQDHFKTRFSIAIEVINDSSLICSSKCGTIRSSNKLANPVRYITDDPFSFVGNSDATVVYLYSKRYELPYADIPSTYNNPNRYLYENGYIYLQLPNDNHCGTITSIVDYSEIDDTLLVTATAHGLTTGDSINIYYNNSLVENTTVTVIDEDSFYISGSQDYPADKWTLDLTDKCIIVEGAYPLGSMFDNTPEANLNGTIFTDDTELPLPEDLIQAIKMKLLGGELSIIDGKDKVPDSHIDN